ncbi:aspartate racemase [Pokkaliibacter plantistimulans]|uniref:Aspartate racemase n=1 Tax=Proteobacteria bacterium 228 TaxID=2083153 RepID=A0A2S5KMX1_9PROT|nr:amino acid racemase [Pokkaliibacter plantistimulans]PPC75656.1 aspartate racemase [Pokkaliibacter plantistimulans]
MIDKYELVDHAEIKQRSYGIVGGLGAIAGADILLKMVRLSQGSSSTGTTNITFEQRNYEETSSSGVGSYDPTRRKFYVYNVLKDLEARNINIALVPCFLSHTFLSEIAPELGLRIVNIFEAIRTHIDKKYSDVRRIGVLTSSYVRDSGIFERELGSSIEILYPRSVAQEKYMTAIYGPLGVRVGNHNGECLDLLFEACADLIEQGAQVIVPGATEVPVLSDALRPLLPVSIIDTNQVYAEYALNVDAVLPTTEYKLGVLGGVGPAATVDFMRKVVRLTQARKDQDHIKMVVEQNPKIPDRTANLVADGDDPTIPLLATCIRLQQDGAMAIAIPCNTAHAFVKKIQPHLSIPIINMLSEVVEYLHANNPSVSRIGLLATSGTVKSGVYHESFESSGMEVLVPDELHQDMVMDAIYGEQGVKAGFTNGLCTDYLMATIKYLTDQGAQAIILGCTELPLIELDISGVSVMLVDPTEILAAKCVWLAQKDILNNQ